MVDLVMVAWRVVITGFVSEFAGKIARERTMDVNGSRPVMAGHNGFETDRAVLIRDLNAPKGFVLDVAGVHQSVPECVDAAVDALMSISRATSNEYEFSKLTVALACQRSTAALGIGLQVLMSTIWMSK
jgi:hypothetical protein